MMKEASTYFAVKVTRSLLDAVNQTLNCLCLGCSTDHNVEYTLEQLDARAESNFSVGKWSVTQPLSAMNDFVYVLQSIL